MGDAKRLEAAIREAMAGSGTNGWPEAPASACEGMDGENKGAAGSLPAITFHAYMAMCLYDERDGYYRSGSVRVGKSGDFYTSSAIGSVMGNKLAGYVAKLAAGQRRPAAIMEWGAGTGALSFQLLSAWERGGVLPAFASARYILVDSNPVHLAEAQSRFAAWPGGAAGPSLSFMKPEEAEAYLAREGEERFTAVIANELLDAFPVHRVVRRNGRLWELGAAAAEAGAGAAFRYVHMPLSDERIEAALLRDGMELREGQIAEVNLEAERWIAKLGGLIRQGCLTLIDYGHEARELAAPHRMRGTLLCYRDHIARDEPFLDPGGQDITAHVNFTACMAAGAEAGWATRYYGTQKRFLVDEGLLADLAEHDGSDPFGEAARHNRAIRQLLLSDAMSETFKVLVLDK